MGRLQHVTNVRFRVAKNYSPMAGLGRERTAIKQKLARCEWLLWYDFNGLYE
jgi:hypothetical protein